MRFFKLITMGTLWMWTRIFGIDSKIMIISKAAKHSVKGKLIVNYVKNWTIWTIDFQSSKNNPILQHSAPIFRYDETAFDPKYENLPLSEFRPMLKRILQRYIMVIHIQAEITLRWQKLSSSKDIFSLCFRKPYDMAETRISCAIVAAKQELSRAYDFEEWKKDNLN